jgi:hypothetical protein
MRQIRFLHVPKTAGSSFARSLARVYGGSRLRGNVFTFRGDLAGSLARYRALGPARRAALVIVTGHAPLVTGEPGIDALPTLTFLREPVAQLRSLCQHLSEGKSPHVCAAGELDVDALLDKAAPTANMQTRFLLGVGSYALPERDPAALAHEALGVLERRLVAYGLTERFDESLMLFRRDLGWRSWPVYPRLNVRSATRRLRFEPRHVERMREMSAIDTMLYEAARARFLGRLERDAVPLAADMRRFRVMQAVNAPFLSVYKLHHALRLLLQRRPADQRARTR